MLCQGLDLHCGGWKESKILLDDWLGQCPLYIVFPKFFHICNEQNKTVYEVLKNNELNLTFRRTFGVVEMEEWQQLFAQVGEVQLTGATDSVTWGLTKNGRFTNASLYRE